MKKCQMLSLSLSNLLIVLKVKSTFHEKLFQKEKNKLL